MDPEEPGPQGLRWDEIVLAEAEASLIEMGDIHPDARNVGRLMLAVLWRLSRGPAEKKEGGNGSSPPPG